MRFAGVQKASVETKAVRKARGPPESTGAQVRHVCA
jgi:hypothetical protein